MAAPLKGQGTNPHEQQRRGRMSLAHGRRKCPICVCNWPVGFQNSATGLELGFYAARSYSLMRPPGTVWRLIRSGERPATRWSGRGGWSWPAAVLPGPGGSVRLRVTGRRCPRGTVPGVTSRRLRGLPGSSRVRAARTARSAPSGRAADGPGAAPRPRAAARPVRRSGTPATGRAGPASRRAGRR